MVPILIATAIGVAFFAVSIRVIRILATPGPEEPDPEHIVEVEAHYRCTVCGLRLTVTHAQDQDAEAPRHCREDMVDA